MGCFTIRPVEKAYTMYSISYCVDLWYIWFLKGGFSRQTLLAIWRRLILVVSWFEQCITRHYILDKLLCRLWIHLVIGNWFNLTQCVSWFTNIFFAWFDQWKSWHHVLFKLLCWIGVHLLIGNRFKQTHYVDYFTKIIIFV